MLSRLLDRQQEMPGVWSVRFTKPDGFDFTAGDYTELELDYHGGGGRRWFSLSSAPSEKHLQITFKLPDPHSEFKAHLMKLEPGDAVQVAPPMGNFNLPVLPKKVLFIAVGIGATPFRSIVLELSKQKRLAAWDIKMVQAASGSQVLFDKVFSDLGSNRLIVGTRPRLTPDHIIRRVPDTEERIVYLAGPEPVTERLHSQLAKKMPLGRLRLSYFPGYKTSDS